VSYDPAAYGEVWAPVYDDMLAATDRDAQATAERVAALAVGGGVLEFGVGTGRLALPLAARGVRVLGIDASPPMLDRLAAKPGSQDVRAVLGDFAADRVDGAFAVVLIAFNTLFALPEQDLQVAALRNAARHLSPGGAVVLEAFVPTDDRRTPPHHVAGARYRAPDHVSFTIQDHDAVSQRIDSAWVRVTGGRTEVLENTIRYAWPAEIDLMARLAGLGLEHRWAGWRDEPFTAVSTDHVSVYRAAA